MTDLESDRPHHNEISRLKKLEFSRRSSQQLSSPSALPAPAARYACVCRSRTALPLLLWKQRRADGAHGLQSRSIATEQLLNHQYLKAMPRRW
jgi:hypothetical protein